MNKKLQKVLVKFGTGLSPLWILLLIGVGGAYSVLNLSGLKLDYNIESFFAKNDPEVKFYNEFKLSFENENNYLLIGIKNKEGVFNQEFFKKVDSLSGWLEGNERVQKVYSPTTISNYVKVPVIGVSKFPLVHINDIERLEEDKKRIYNQEDYARSFFSEDTLSVQIITKLTEVQNRKEGDQIINEIENNINAFSFDEWHTAGRIKTQQFYVSEMKSEMRFFAVVAFLIILIALWVVLRKIKYMIWSFLVIFISLLFVFGVIAICNYPINLMLTILPAIILITGTSGTVHFITKFREFYSNEYNLEKSINSTIKEVGVPIFFNALTTSIGFATLWVIPVEPIQYFGLFSAIGVLITFFVGVLLLPALMKLQKSSKSIIVSNVKKTSRNRSFWFFEKSYKIRIVTIIGGVIGLYGITNIEVGNHFLDDLHDKSTLKKDLGFFENNFAGIRPFELVVTSKEKGSINTPQFIKEIEVLTEFLSKEYGVKNISSVSGLVKSINKSEHGGKTAFYKVPSSDKELQKIIRLVEKRNLWNKYALLADSTLSQTRISGRSKDWGSQIINSKNKQLLEFVASELPNLEVHLTGAAHLMDRANANISNNLLLGISLAVLISSLCVLLLTQSIRLALLSIIPNSIPLIFAGLIMLIFGIELKIGIAMVFTIIYGLAVDDTMHFLYNYKSLARERSDIEAVKETYIRLEKPMRGTTVILSLGFLVFSTSQFTSIAMIGFLISTSLVVALLADFIVLPAFLISGNSKKI